ncbi:hypothetical protein OH77DRAFT_1109202 [Trametes cingulata]|nr:hypothetical protein OH77DRAFT_1109202 [Trametes cingulata]
MKPSYVSSYVPNPTFPHSHSPRCPPPIRPRVRVPVHVPLRRYPAFSRPGAPAGGYIQYAARSKASVICVCTCVYVRPMRASRASAAPRAWSACGSSRTRSRSASTSARLSPFLLHVVVRGSGHLHGVACPTIHHDESTLRSYHAKRKAHQPCARLAHDARRALPALLFAASQTPKSICGLT